MKTDEGGRSPRTLADVSHLFFSNVDDTADDSLESDGVERTAEPAGPAGAADAGRAGSVSEPNGSAPVSAADEAVRAPATSRRDRAMVLVVTGAEDSPGKSTVAVNFAQALMPFGRVALFDADPHVPNARFYVGLPSWHYLSRLTGDGTSAPNLVTDSGLIVVDWSAGDGAPVGPLAPGGAIHVDVPGVGRRPVDIAVVDVPAHRTGLLQRLADLAPTTVIVSRPGRSGFMSAFAALAAVSMALGTGRAAVVVNRAPDADHARRFCAKIEAASERLLSVRTHHVGSVPFEPGLGGTQRDRGAIVASQPDAVTALALREAASNAMELARADDLATRGVLAAEEDRR